MRLTTDVLKNLRTPLIHTCSKNSTINTIVIISFKHCVLCNSYHCTIFNQYCSRGTFKSHNNKIDFISRSLMLSTDFVINNFDNNLLVTNYHTLSMLVCYHSSVVLVVWCTPTPPAIVKHTFPPARDRSVIRAVVAIVRQ